MPAVLEAVGLNDPSQDSRLGRWRNGLEDLARRAGSTDGAKLFREISAYHDRVDTWKDGLAFFERDIAVLARHRGLELSPGLWTEVRELATEFSELSSTAPPVSSFDRPLERTTREILRRPLLTSTDFHLFTQVIQSLGSGYAVDVASALDPLYPEYYRYEVVAEIRRAFRFIALVMARWSVADRDLRYQTPAQQLFQESSQLEDMIPFRKALASFRLRKNLDAFRQAHQLGWGHLEGLIQRIGQHLGASQAVFSRQVKAVHGCECWSGVNSIDLVIRRIGLKRPDLVRDFKERLTRWKDQLVERQAREKAIKEVAFSPQPEVELAPGIYLEILVAIGAFSDFIGTLTLVRDLVKRLRMGSDDELFALLVNLLLRTLVPDIWRYQCWGNGEYNTTERLIQTTTLELALDVQRLLKTGAQRGVFLPLETFWGAIFVYKELLVALHIDKPRDYLKPSEKDGLADLPATPNRLFLFEKTHVTSRGTRVGLVPIAKAWEPFVRHYALKNGVEALLATDRQKVLDALERWLSRGARRETPGIGGESDQPV